MRHGLAQATYRVWYVPDQAHPHWRMPLLRPCVHHMVWVLRYKSFERIQDSRSIWIACARLVDNLLPESTPRIDVVAVSINPTLQCGPNQLVREFTKQCHGKLTKNLPPCLRIDPIIRPPTDSQRINCAILHSEDLKYESPGFGIRWISLNGAV